VKYPKPIRGYHSRPRMTLADMRDSDALRLRALASRIDRHLLAFAAGISTGHLAKWLSQRNHLAPEHQRSLAAWLEKQRL
jgi:hypothetical protein